MITSVEKRGRFWKRYYVARNSATGMVAYDRTAQRALMRLVKMHVLMIEMLKKRELPA